MISQNELTRLVNMMKEKGLYKLDVRYGGRHIYLKRKADQERLELQEEGEPEEKNQEQIEEKENERIKPLISLQVGTFYRSLRKDGSSVKKEGDPVKEGETVGFIEVMRVMHNVKSPYEGTIKEFLVQEGAIVEYGQPLVLVALKEGSDD